MNITTYIRAKKQLKTHELTIRQVDNGTRTESNARPGVFSCFLALIFVITLLTGLPTVPFATKKKNTLKNAIAS